MTEIEKALDEIIVYLEDMQTEDNPFKLDELRNTVGREVELFYQLNLNRAYRWNEQLSELTDPNNPDSPMWKDMI